MTSQNREALVARGALRERYSELESLDREYTRWMRDSMKKLNNRTYPCQIGIWAFLVVVWILPQPYKGFAVAAQFALVAVMIAFFAADLRESRRRKRLSDERDAEMDRLQVAFSATFRSTPRP